MGPWVSRSRSGKQLALAVGSSVAGLCLTIGFRGFLTSGRDAFAGFLLGLMLLIIGIAGALASGPQTVTVDPRARHIRIEQAYLVGSRSRTIGFDEIAGVTIGYLGKASNYVQRYYLVLHLRGGRVYPLFAPGRFFDGSTDRSSVEGWRTRLLEYMEAVSPSQEGVGDSVARG